MFFYSILLFIIFFILLGCNENHPKYKRSALFIITIIFILLIGLRNIDIGLNDTKVLYAPEFYKIQKLNMVDIILNFKDPIFYIFTKICTLFSSNIQIWLTLCASLYIIPTMKLVKEESKIPIISIFVFIALNYLGMGFSGIRHCIATGVLCYTFKPLKEEKFRQFLIIVLIASFFHISALIMLITYPILKLIKINEKKVFNRTILLIIIIYIINNICGRQIVNFVMNMIVNVLNLERFTIYLSENFSFLSHTSFYINFLIYFFTGTILTTGKMEKEECVLMNLQLIATILTIFVSTLGEFYRLSLFFSIFSVLLIPLAINKIPKGNIRGIIILVLVFLLGTYFLLFSARNNGIMPYKIFFLE